MDKNSSQDALKIVQLGDVLTLNYGKNLIASQRKKGIYPVYGSNGIVDYHNDAIVKSPGIIVGRKGTVGSVHYSPTPFNPIDTTYYITQEDTKLNLPYLFYVLKNKNLSTLKADVGVPGLNRNVAYNEDLLITEDEKEQQNIVYILSTFEKAIQKQEEIINITTALRKSLLNKLFTEGTKGESLKQTEAGMIPESWKVVTIGSLGKVVTGSTPKTSVAEYYQPEEYDFIAPVDIGKNWIVGNAQKKISSKGLSVSRPLPKNTVLAVCIGSTIGKVGLTSKELSATNQQINAIVCDESVNNPWFVYYLLTFYNNLWKEAATPSPVPILTKGQFEKILIPYTEDLVEQTLIAESLIVFENKLKYHSNKKSICENLFKSLLNELLNGVIRVNDLDFHSMASSLKTITA